MDVNTYFGSDLSSSRLKGGRTMEYVNFERQVRVNTPELLEMTVNEVFDHIDVLDDDMHTVLVSLVEEVDDLDVDLDRIPLGEMIKLGIIYSQYRWKI